MTSERIMKLKPALFFGIIFLFIPFANVLLIEGIHRGGIRRAALPAFFDWVQADTWAFVLTYLFMILFIGILYVLPGKLFYLLAILQMILWTVVSFASYQKFQMRGDPFVPSDFYLLQEGADISAVIGDVITIKEMIGAGMLLFLIAVLVTIFVKLGIKTSFKYRLLISSLSLLLLLVLVNKAVDYTVEKTSDLAVAEKYQELGFIGGFINAAEEAKGEEPENYSKATVNKIVTGFDKTDVDPKFKPNVIVVLAESLWDPTKLENAEFQDDPIPYYRSLMENHTSGEMLIHSYGGGTLYTELEVLTGLTRRFMPEGADTYNQHIVKPVDSLAHVFKEQGYHTTALHNFQSWFYKRGDIYRWLGFEKFVSMEFLNDPKFIGYFVDDREIMKVALDELDKTKGPDFINTVTVQTHGDYANRKFENMKEWAKGTGLSDADKHTLNEYSQSINELDQAIKMLIEGVEKRDEPTMVVIYGDHLPPLGTDYSVYKGTGYLKDINTHEDYLKMYTTPLLVWDNFSTPSEKEDLRMSSNFLGSYILEKAKKEKSPIFSISGETYKNGVHVIPTKPFLKAEGIDEAKLEEYKILQYDMIFGERYAYKDRPLKTVPGYHHGSEKLALRSLSVEKENGKQVIHAKGKGFVMNAAIYINSEKVETKYQDSEHVYAVVPDKLADAGKVSVTVEVVDRKKSILAKTEAKNITLK